MQVKLIRRWSAHDVNSVVDTDDVQGQWLLDHGFAKRVNDDRTHEQVEGDLKPTHSLSQPGTRRNRPETGVAGAADGAPDAVHNRVHPEAGETPPAKSNRRTKNA